MQPRKGLCVDAGVSGKGPEMYLIVTDLSNGKIIHSETIQGEYDSTRAELIAIKRALNFAYYDCDVWNDNLSAVNAINHNYNTNLEPLAKEVRKVAYERNIHIRYWNKKVFGEIPSDCKFKFKRERRHSWKLKKQLT